MGKGKCVPKNKYTTQLFNLTSNWYYLFKTVLQLGFEKGRVLIQKRALSACNDRLRWHFKFCEETVKHMFKTKFGIYTANTAAIFVTSAQKVK